MGYNMQLIIIFLIALVLFDKKTILLFVFVVVAEVRCVWSVLIEQSKMIAHCVCEIVSNDTCVTFCEKILIEA